MIRKITPKPFDYDAWLKSLGQEPFSPEFVKAVEEQISQRRLPLNRTGAKHSKRRPKKR